MAQSRQVASSLAALAEALRLLAEAAERQASDRGARVRAALGSVVYSTIAYLLLGYKTQERSNRRAANFK
jgi:crotonobetainyl-CoA:carnitine CoA-transferase CaiB-like acyl-CoA transferase